MSVRLDDAFDGNTCFWPHIAKNYLTRSGWVNAKQYHVTLNPNIDDLLNDKLLVGAIDGSIGIAHVTLTFHGSDDNVLQNDLGQRLQFDSNPRDLGHLFELMDCDMSYAYAKLLFTLVWTRSSIRRRCSCISLGQCHIRRGQLRKEPQHPLLYPRQPRLQQQPRPEPRRRRRHKPLQRGQVNMRNVFLRFFRQRIGSRSQQLSRRGKGTNNSL